VSRSNLWLGVQLSCARYSDQLLYQFSCLAQSGLQAVLRTVNYGGSLDSTAGTVTRLRLQAGWCLGGSNPSRGKRFTKTSRPAVGPLGSFLRGKGAGAWSWPLSFVLCQGKECVELYLCFPCAFTVYTGTAVPVLLWDLRFSQWCSWGFSFVECDAVLFEQ